MVTDADAPNKPKDGRTLHSATMKRYLREGNEEEAHRRGEREGYEKGPAGMTDYLVDWERKWKKATEEPKKRGRYIHFPLQRLLVAAAYAVQDLADSTSTGPSKL